jgi:adenine-specific DNA-methyltransferase
MQLNAEDGGHRQCILVTNNENNICEEVTFERNKRVIEGYTTPKGEKVKGLQDNNLRYFKVGFTPREKTDENMFRLAKNSINLLRIKHDVYKEKQFGALENPYKRYRYFEEDGKQLLVILDTELIGDIVEQLEEMEVSKPIPTYVFTTGAYPFTEDFESVADKVELYPLPHGIYQACERVMPKMIDKEIENPEGISLSNEELETSMDDLTKEEA